MERLTGWLPGTSALDILRGGKVLAAKQAHRFNTKRRSVFAAAFATRVVERYWEEIQVGYRKTWSLPSVFTEPDLRILTDEAKWLAGAIGRAAAQVDPVTAVLPKQLLREHGGAVVENHLNMVRPLQPVLAVKPDVLAAFLNSGVADQAFRCLSGSVAVSAYELEALPLPPPDALSGLSHAVACGASREATDKICARMYGLV